MRNIYVELELDEEIADRYAETNGIADSAPIAYLEHEIGWLAASGFTLISAFIADDDDSDLRARYVNYVADWVMERAGDCCQNDSPMNYDEWFRVHRKGMESKVR